MTITLPDDLQRVVQRQLDSGRFASPADVLAAALKLLDHREELRQAIAVGIEQADRGQVAPFCAADTLARVRASRTTAPGPTRTAAERRDSTEPRRGGCQ